MSWAPDDHYLFDMLDEDDRRHELDDLYAELAIHQDEGERLLDRLRDEGYE